MDMDAFHRANMRALRDDVDRYIATALDIPIDMVIRCGASSYVRFNRYASTETVANRSMESV
jgi:hypothetical protein